MGWKATGSIGSSSCPAAAMTGHNRDILAKWESMTTPVPQCLTDHCRPIGRRRWILTLMRVPLALLLAMPIASAASESNPADRPPEQRVIRMSPDAFSQKIEAISEAGAVVVMAAWCAPCRKELPDLVRLHEKYADEGLEMLGMSIDYAGPEVAGAMVAEHKVTFPVYWVGEAGMRRFAIKAIPLLMLVRNGRIVERIEGVRKPSELDRRLRELIESVKASTDAPAPAAPTREDSP